MEKFEIGKEYRFISPFGEIQDVYRLCLTYGDFNDLDVIIPVVYWTQHDGFETGGASAIFTLKDMEDNFNDGTWVLVEE